MFECTGVDCLARPLRECRFLKLFQGMVMFTVVIGNFLLLKYFFFNSVSEKIRATYFRSSAHEVLQRSD